VGKDIEKVDHKRRSQSRMYLDADVRIFPSWICIERGVKIASPDLANVNQIFSGRSVRPGTNWKPQATL